MIEKHYSIGSIVDATEDDARRLAPNLRESDIVELAAFAGIDPETALLGALNQAKFALALRDAQGMPVSMLGVGWLENPRTGSAWFLSSEALDAFGLVFLQETRTVFDDLVAGHDVVSNWVHTVNAKTLRWLRWLGFEELDRFTSERSGETFLEMARFASPEVRDLYVKRNWAAYHSTLPAADNLRAAGFSLGVDGRQGSSFTDA